MENAFLSILLVIGIVIFAIPQPVLKTVRKAMPALLLFAAVLGIAFSVQRVNVASITITAQGDRNEAAQGTEIFLEKVVVNDQEHAPADYFDQGWIEQDGGLLWRDYEQPEGMKNTIAAKFYTGDVVRLVLKSNKWQGKAKIVSWQGNQDFDGYTDTEENGEFNFDFSPVPKIIGKNVIVPAAFVLWIALSALALLCTRFSKEPASPAKSRILGLDILKIFSALMIVVIHASSGVYNNHTLGSFTWKTGLLLNAFTRFAVPSFLMITGALVLGKDISVKKAVRKAVFAGVALLFWSFSYIIVRKLLWGEGDVLQDTWMLLFKRGPSGHLWYGYLLVWIYLFSPILSALYRALDEKQRLYFVGIALAAPSIIDGIIGYFSLDAQFLIQPYFIYLNTGYMAVMFLGKIIYDHQDKWKGWMGAAAMVGGYCITVGLSFFVSRRTGASQHTFFDELQVSNVLYASGVMLLMCRLKGSDRKSMAKTIITRISEISLGIYFAHVLAMWIFGNDLYIWGRHLNLENSVWECLIFVGIYFVLTVLFLWPVSKIPGLKKLVKVS